MKEQKIVMKLSVEVFYHCEGQLHHVNVDWFEGMRVTDALNQAKYALTDKQSIGIFGKLVSLDTLVMPGDRIEVYRPLLIDPKEARRNRASLNKKKK